MLATLEGFKAWAATRGYDDVASATDDKLAQALIRAYDYVTAFYIANLCPGYDATLPVLEDVTYIIAYIEFKTPFIFSKVYTPAEQKVLTEVKGIKWTVLGGAEGKFTPVSSLAEALMTKYLCLPKEGAVPFNFVSLGGRRCDG